MNSQDFDNLMDLRQADKRALIISNIEGKLLYIDDLSTKDLQSIERLLEDKLNQKETN